MKKYKIVGVEQKGSIVHAKLGTFNLEILTDEDAEKLFKEGCTFIELVKDEKADKKEELKK